MHVWQSAYLTNELHGLISDSLKRQLFDSLSVMYLLMLSVVHTTVYEGCSKSIGPLAEKNTFTRLEVCNPNPLRSSLLVTEHTSPSGSAIVRSISGMPLCE